MNKGQGTTASTFKALRGMLALHRPAFWVGENLADMGKQGSALKQWLQEVPIGCNDPPEMSNDSA
eukprot:10067232-Alexandrium_andersonii.AAC.1